MDQANELSLLDFIHDDECSNLVSQLPLSPAEITDNSVDIEVGFELGTAEIEVQRSKRRRKTSSAFRRDGKIIVQVPARMSQREVNLTVRELVSRIESRERISADPDALLARARKLVATYFDSDIISAHPVPVTIKWVRNQNSRWGSCTPATGVIRLSHRLISMPDYVQDAVLMHELVHLLVHGHNEEFYRYLNRFPDLQLANAYLAGYSQAMADGN